MTQKSKQLVFFGTEDFSAKVLTKLLDAGIKFEAVITKPDLKKGRGQKLQSPAVKEVAKEYGVPVFQPNNLEEMRACIEQTSKFTALLVSFGKIIPQDIIDAFEVGIINLHPSLLPKYRGPSPIETAILNGDEITGVSIMALNAKMDAGPVYAQEVIPLTNKLNARDVYEQAIVIGSRLLIQTLPQIMAKSLTPTPQDESQATYCNLLTKAQSYLQPEIKTAEQLACQVRSFAIFPRSRFVFYDQVCIIEEASADIAPNSPLNLECADGNFLNITKLIAPSGKTMSAEAFVNGYKN